MVFETRSGISRSTISRRFGGLEGTISRFREWLEVNEPASPLVEAIRTKSRYEIPAPPEPGGVGSPARPRAWPVRTGLEFGPPLSFRGLRHAPINEQGVVFLFGMVAYELGFIVEAVNAAFPDCHAKRFVEGRRDRMQSVRVEFEFYSSNFKDHGHDPKSVRLDRLLGTRLDGLPPRSR